MKARKKVVVLGGGISGLSAAYILGKEWNVTLIEKKGQVGGCIETVRSAGYLFEKGPRTFPTARSCPLLELVKELNLETSLIAGSPQAHRRYLWHAGKLHAVPGNPLSPVLRPLLAALLFKEWRVPKREEDETVWDFAHRRFNQKVADLLFDPIAMGIYGGDAKKLSCEAAFPFLKKMERESGSLIKGLFRKKRAQGALPVASLSRGSLFSFEKGIGFFAKKLSDALVGDVRLEEEVLALHRHNGRWEVLTDRGSASADCVVSALPSHQLGRLVHPLNREIAELLLSIPHQSLTTVNVGYQGVRNPTPGFGYLVPSCEQEAIGGVIFDSSLFPAHQQGKEQTRLTAFLPGLPTDPEGDTLRALRRHLSIGADPDFIQVSRSPDAIPQYHLGHQGKIHRLQSLVNQSFPTLFLTGNYLAGVSVSDCIQQAQRCAHRIQNKF